MKEETKRRREQEKRDSEARKNLLDNEAFHKFLKYLHSNASVVEAYQAKTWLPGWLITGCELYFTDIEGRIKEIVG